MSDFEKANEILRANVRGVCERYLPQGKQKGEWWLVSTPWRVDKNPSLCVNLKSGKWKDMARTDEHGDLIDLIARVSGEAPIAVVNRVIGG